MAERVYCAGPLFNQKEQEEMAEIAKVFESAQFETFLPQRDGLEFAICTEQLTAEGLDATQAATLVAKAIFSLDVYQVVEDCDAIVVNLNGRVPDEGAVSEAALAWCSGKVVIGYKADHRSVFLGQDNPLVAGLFDFKIHDSMAALVTALREALASRPSREKMLGHRRQELQLHLEFGRRLWDAMRAESKGNILAELIRLADGVEAT